VQAGAGTETLEIRTSTIITLGFHPAVASLLSHTADNLYLQYEYLETIDAIIMSAVSP
jgi:hypothetical protein